MELAALDVRRAIVESAARELVSFDASANPPLLVGYAPLWLSPRVFGGNEALAWQFYEHPENWRVLLLSLVCDDLRAEAVTGGWPTLLEAITVWYDIRLVHSREWIDDERDWAMRRLAERVPPTRSAKAKGALRELAGEQGTSQSGVWHTQICPEAVFLAVEKADHPPLPPRAYAGWLLNAARSEARRLLEQEYLTPIARDIHNQDRRQERRRKPTPGSFLRDIFSLRE
jgi:hypothetical protein